MLDWLLALPTIAVTILVLFIPGLIFVFVSNWRSFLAYAFAPVASLACYGLLAILFDILNLPWQAFTVLPVAIILALALGLLTKKTFLRAYTPERFDRVYVAPWACSALVLTAIAMFSFATPDNISQTFDNVFHLNATAYILQHGVASPMAVGDFSSGGAGGIYPALWHAMVALIAKTTGAELAVAVNALVIAILICVWIPAALTLTAQLLGPRPAVLYTTAFFAVIFPEFPLHLVYYGVLYPFFMGLSMLALLLTFVFTLLKQSSSSNIPIAFNVFALLVVLCAIMLAHPSVFAAASFIVAGPLIVFVWHKLNLSLYKRIFCTAVFAIFYLFLQVLLFKQMNVGVSWSSRGAPWDGVRNVLQVELLIGGGTTALAVFAFWAAGFYLIFRFNKTALIVSLLGAAGAFLYAVAFGVSRMPFRALVGVWYADSPRLAAICIIALMPFLVFGLVSFLDSLRLNAANKKLFLTACLLVGVLSSGLPNFIYKAHTGYKSENLLSKAEQDFLENVVANEVPKDKKIVGSASTGVALSYAFAGREAYFSHIHAEKNTPETKLIATKLDELNTNPAVCAAVLKNDIGYALDFGEKTIFPDEYAIVHKGIDKVQTTPGFTLIASDKDIALYRIDGCK